MRQGDKLYFTPLYTCSSGSLPFVVTSFPHALIIPSVDVKGLFWNSIV